MDVHVTERVLSDSRCLGEKYCAGCFRSSYVAFCKDEDSGYRAGVGSHHTRWQLCDYWKFRVQVRFKKSNSSFSVDGENASFSSSSKKSKSITSELDDCADPTPESVVAALNLHSTVTFDELLSIVAEAHGKPIKIKEVDNDIIPTVTGLWVEKETKSLIFLPTGDNSLHRTHAACHEFGHMLLGHTGCGVPEDFMPSMFQHVGGKTGIKKILARSLDWNDTERAAERVAYLLCLALLPNEPQSMNEFERTFI